MTTEIVTRPEDISQEPTCANCGMAGDLNHEQICRDRVLCVVHVTVNDYEHSRISPQNAVVRLMTCYRLAASHETAMLAYAFAKAIEEAEDKAHERSMLRGAGEVVA